MTSKRHILSNLLFASLILNLFTLVSCEKDSESDPVCNDCGTASRLPSDIVELEGIYAGVEFIDTDNDGDLDLVFGDWDDPEEPINSWDKTDRLLFNNGEGYFADVPNLNMPPNLFNGPWSFTTDIKRIDANNYGFMDMVLAVWKGDLTGKKLQLLINDGTGTFRDETNKITENSNKESHIGRIGALDAQGDGLTDIMTGNGVWNSNGSIFQKGMLAGGNRFLTVEW